MKTHKRILMITRALPIEASGTLIVIRRLLENVADGNIWILGRTPAAARVINDPLVGCHLTEIRIPQVRGYRLWMFLSIIPGFFQGLWLIYRHNIRSIIGVYPDQGSLLLAFLLHLVSRRPLLMYFCDLYMENKQGLEGWLASWVQPLLFKRATIIAFTPAMQTLYQERYGIQCALLPYSINESIPVHFDLPRDNAPFIIGYSGSVVPDRIDPMRSLVKALSSLDQVELRIFTPQSETFLKENGLFSNKTIRKFCTSRTELLQELEQCHLLYLPLTFLTDGNSADQLKTCFGSKAYEYFLSCRPVLVHAPKDYFTYQFFEINDCGYRISEQSPEQIAALIHDIIQQQYSTTSQRYIRNALIAVEANQGRQVSNTFYQIIDDNI